MASINERLAAVETGLEENNRTTWRLFEALYGNGKPGLLSEFQMLRESVEQHHNAVETLQRRGRGFWQWLITTLIAAAAVVVAFIK